MKQARFFGISGAILLVAGLLIASTYGSEFEQTIVDLAAMEEVTARQALERSR
jgi:hypothetical protein